MNEKVFVCDRFTAFFALFGSCFTLLQVEGIIPHWDIQVAILTILSPRIALILMSGDFIRLDLLFTVFAGGHFVELLLMFLLKVDIVHLATFRAFLDVSTTISEMSGNFGFGE